MPYAVRNPRPTRPAEDQAVPCPAAQAGSGGPGWAHRHRGDAPRCALHHRQPRIPPRRLLRSLVRLGVADPRLLGAWERRKKQVNRKRDAKKHLRWTVPDLAKLGVKLTPAQVRRLQARTEE